MTIRIASWSGPRTISTAMMRAWENRPDCAVVDEPLYAAHLARTGLDHPGAREVIGAGETDPRRAITAVLEDDRAPVQYVKHMAQHLPDDLDLSWTFALHNILLVRDPREVVASYVRARESVAPEDLGVLQQVRLQQTWSEHGVSAPVIEVSDFLAAPQAYLRHLCSWVGVEFTDAMLSWPPGPRSSDGVWARYWYDAVRASTGFEAPRARSLDLAAHESQVAERCRPAYEQLHAVRLVL